MRTTVSSKGQIVLPAEMRQQDEIVAGQEFEVERIESGQYLLKRIPAGNGAGVVDWLRACPVGDWFQSLPSESTSEL